jgi:hypothetical protein
MHILQFELMVTVMVMVVISGTTFPHLGVVSMRQLGWRWRYWTWA